MLRILSKLDNPIRANGNNSVFYSEAVESISSQMILPITINSIR